MQFSEKTSQSCSSLFNRRPKFRRKLVWSVSATFTMRKPWLLFLTMVFLNHVSCMITTLSLSWEFWFMIVLIATIWLVVSIELMYTPLTSRVNCFFLMVVFSSKTCMTSLFFSIFFLVFSVKDDHDIFTEKPLDSNRCLQVFHLCFNVSYDFLACSGPLFLCFLFWGNYCLSLSSDWDCLHSRVCWQSWRSCYSCSISQSDCGDEFADVL